MHTAHSDAGLFWYDSGVCRRYEESGNGFLTTFCWDFNGFFMDVLDLCENGSSGSLGFSSAMFTGGFSWIFLISMTQKRF